MGRVSSSIQQKCQIINEKAINEKATIIVIILTRNINEH